MRKFGNHLLLAGNVAFLFLLVTINAKAFFMGMLPAFHLYTLGPVVALAIANIVVSFSRILHA